MNTIPAIIPIAIPIALTGDKAVIPLNNGGVSDNTASLNLGFPPDYVLAPSWFGRTSAYS